MTKLEALDLIYGLVKSTWEGMSEGTISWPDVIFDIPNSEWARVTTVSGGGDQSSLSDDSSRKLWTITGTLYVECFSPIGIGPQRPSELASGFVTAFRTVSNPQIFYRRPRQVEAKPDGAFSKELFLVDFEYTTVA